MRDILFVEDLENAFVLAQKNIATISGNAFNMGGGVANTISLLELLEMIGEITGRKPKAAFHTWRPSDQKYYVSDFGKFHKATGWLPKNGTKEGVSKLCQWLQENADVPAKEKMMARNGVKRTSKNLEPIDK